MKRLAEEKLQITLALSLRGSTQEKRKVLMPIANKYKISQILEACKYYFNITGYINVLMDVRINVQIKLVSSVSNHNETGETNFETS